jgi:DNA-binding MarR family transcriptional regulator
MTISYEGVQRRHGIGTTSYLPGVRAVFEFPQSADADVQRWRRMGASWQAIATNFGCSVDKVRRVWDPSYVPLHTPAQPIVASRPSAAVPVGSVARNSYQFDVLVALQAGPLARADLRPLIATRRADFYRLVVALKDKRLLAERRGDVVELTAAGRAELDWHLHGDPGGDVARERRRRAVQHLASQRERNGRVLVALAEGPATAVELSERLRLGVEKARDILAALRADGEVELLRGKRDRAYLWALTELGRANLPATGKAAAGE